MADSPVFDPSPSATSDLPVRATLDRLRLELLDERTADGHWTGELSPSALSTATAISAIAAVLKNPNLQNDRPREHWIQRIDHGIRYLCGQQNDDGGFGDTDRSHSNIATSYLVLAASALAQQVSGTGLQATQLTALQEYIDRSGRIDALRQRYGTDKTFVVPILTNLAIAELVDWGQVPRLPFEAAVFPQSMYRLLSMPVVSYAIPALVAIGQARHFCGPKAWFPIRLMRHASVDRTMKVLRKMQPQSGGYLEATPLTSFVVMSLAATGRVDNDVCREGLRFLDESMNDEGAWPIDTNLATWVTSLAMEALTSDPQDDGTWCSDELIRWHLGCQHRQRHPFTGAEPGGWGWSDLSGAVPDSDDTPAAILALSRAKRWIKDDDVEPKLGIALNDAVGWLQRLQNRDGGWPTFCRGWGKLPFDRSSNDLTAHAIRAVFAASNGNALEIRDDTFIRRGVNFLTRHQQPDGSWLPLWFGNQDREDESNPIYGTAKVLATVTTGTLPSESIRRGCDYLLKAQNPDGGWGGGASVTRWHHEQGLPGEQGLAGQQALPGQQGLPRETALKNATSSVEETALAVDALISVVLTESSRDQGTGSGVSCEPLSINSGDGDDLIDRDPSSTVNPPYREAIIRGVQFLVACVDDDRHRVPWPIGFYFAKLWYHEKLYPLIFTVSALGKYDQLASQQPDADWPR
ncbi:MAG: prenyltransferase/squalene oxidase repeat-containing protein [Planctomycetota bacterium]